MKIAILSFYSGHHYRGVENWALELSEKLKKNHSVIIFKNQEKDFNWNRPSSQGLLRRLFLDYWSISILNFTFKILLILWRENFDVIIPTNGGWQAFIVRIFTWVRDRKMIIVGHSGKGWDDRINLWSFPDTFIALTTYAEDWAKRVNPFVKIVHIPNGVNLEKFTPIGKKLKTKLKNPIVLVCSALVKSKRIELTIKALALIDSVDLLVVGIGDEEKKLRDIGEKLLGKRFQIISVPYNKMPEVYRTADTFTLVSWESEAFPLVYLEAMASNLPVVATQDKIREEIIGDAGILVNPQDTKDYANNLRVALKKNWQDIPRRQAEKFSWDIIADKYEEVMLNLLK